MVASPAEQHLEIRSRLEGVLQPPRIEGSIFPQLSPSPQDMIQLRREGQDVGAPVSSVYPVREDIRFIQDNREQMTPSQIKYYLSENLTAFLGEFAGKIPYKQIRGICLPNELQMGGFGMLRSAQRAVQMKEQGGMNASRERAELEGLGKIHRMIEGQDGEHTNGALWVSASKVADYRMMFGFEVGSYDSELGGMPITEYIINRPERYGTIGESSSSYNLASYLAGINNAPPQSAEDMLRSPIPFRNKLDTHAVLHIAGLTMDEIAYSREYEEMTRTLLGPAIQQYVRLVEHLNDVERNSIPHQHEINDFQMRAQPLVNQMFSVGVQLRRYLQGQMTTDESRRFSLLLQSSLTQSKQNGETNGAMTRYMNTIKQEKIVGGSLCPSWTATGNSSSSLSALVEAGYSVAESMTILAGKGNSGEVWIKGKKHLICKCPEMGCPSNSPPRKVVAPIENNTITCPCCHKTAPYAC